MKKYIDALHFEIEFRIGDNAQDNFDLIDISNPNDIWFHIEGKSSAHVVASIPEHIKIDRKNKKKIITQGALICKQFSKYTKEKDLPVIYTEIKNLTKTEKVGCVLTAHTDILFI